MNAKPTYQELEDRIKELGLEVEKLKNDNNLLENIFTNIPVGLEVFDKDGFSRKINLAQKELLGLSSINEGIGEFNVLTDPFCKANGADKIYQKVYNGETINHEYEYNFDIPENTWKTLRGKRFFQEFIIPILDSAKRVSSIVAILMDITEKKRIEEKLLENDKALKNQNIELYKFNEEYSQITLTLQEKLIELEWAKEQIEASEARIKTLFNSAPDTIFIIEKETEIIVDVNKKILEVYGYSIDEVVGKPNAWVSAELDETRKQTQTPKHFIPIRYHRKKNGEVFPVEITASVITMQGKEYIVANIRDITERQRAEQTLKESEQRFRSIFDNAISGIVFADTNHNLILTNHAIEEMLGYSQEELYGMNISTLLHPDETPQSSKFIMDQISNGKSGYRLERQYITKNKKPIWVDLSVSIIRDQQGQPKFFVGVINDITDKKEVEDRLKELNAAKDKFFSIIAHDLRNPFSAIIGVNELLKDSFKNNNLAEARHYADIIYTSSQNALDLLVNLLEWTRSQTGRITVAPEEIDFTSLIEEVVNLNASTCNQKEIKILKAIEPNLSIHADKNMLSTVVRNLLSNAIKYSFNGGIVSIAALRKNNMLHFSISDRGAGINAKDIPKLFRIDTNFSTPGTLSESGTGLGLIICKDFISKHHGNIWVESTPNEGSTFHFSIPITYESQQL